MKKLKIFVCCYKPSVVKQNEVYIPLHCGRSVSPDAEEMKDMLGDDTGDNISERNPYYSEITGIYWIWKNVHDCEYVGINHYRRAFASEFTEQNVDSFFSDGTDVIMVEGLIQPHMRWSALLQYVQIEDIMILRGVIRKLCPDYLVTLNQYLRDYKSNPFNMVVCKKTLFDEYAQWLFGILFECEKYIRYSGYSNSKRVMGYLAELLCPVYFIHNHYKIKEMPVLVNGELRLHSWQGKLEYFILKNCIWRFNKNSSPYVCDSIYRGLQNDGIDLDCRY